MNFRSAVAELAKIEGIGPDRAAKLVHAGFLSLDGLMAAEIEDLTAIEGITPDEAIAIRAAAEAASAKTPDPAP